MRQNIWVKQPQYTERAKQVPQHHAEKYWLHHEDKEHFKRPIREPVSVSYDELVECEYCYEHYDCSDFNKLNGHNRPP